jgi:hypothetical protein
VNSTPPDDGLNGWRHEELIWTLRWLAADPEAALRATEDIVAADEIAEDLNWWYEVTRGWGLLDDATADALRTIDEQFSSMTASPDLWSDHAIRHSREWAGQRERARALLAQLGAERADDEVGPLRPGGPVYVPTARRLPQLPWRKRP